MPHTRAETEKVEAFSAPIALLEQARAEAARRKMSASGFYRYCLAKILGYSETEAEQIAAHGAVRRLAESVQGTTPKGRYPSSHRSAAQLNEASSKPASVAAKLLKQHVPSPGKKPSAK